MSYGPEIRKKRRRRFIWLASGARIYIQRVCLLTLGQGKIKKIKKKKKKKKKENEIQILARKGAIIHEISLKFGCGKKTVYRSMFLRIFVLRFSAL